MNFNSNAFDQMLFLLFSLVPLGVAIWFIVTLTGIRRAAERIADSIERMSMTGGPRIG